MARGVAITASVIVGLMLLRDGTLPKLITDAANGARDFTTGIKPITRVA